jgi:predicted lipoprotein with Yx(FWY)xxD motif
MKRGFSLVAAAAIAMAFSAGVARAADVKNLQVEQKQPFGQYLTDKDGRALYLFTPDKKEMSACYDKCAEAWPPAIASGKVQTSPNIKENLLGTLKRKDGKTQLTYGGHPLYYFVKDQGPGATAGQDVKGFGGEWYLVKPDGSKVEAKG